MDNESQGLSEDTIEVSLEPRGLVVTGALIVCRLREGCTPGDILDVIADTISVPRDEYRRQVLGVLDGIEPGDLGL